MFNIAQRKPRIEAERTQITRGDEARIFRLKSLDPRTNGLVERVQRLGDGHYPRVVVFNEAKKQGERIHSSPLSGHKGTEVHQAIGYFSGKVAHTLFPVNFVRFRDWWIAKMDGEEHGLIYSDYVPDESGANSRREAHLAEFKSTYPPPFSPLEDHYKCDAERARLVKRWDAEERALNPDLDMLEQEFSRMGVVLAHVEFNYHKHCGRTIFFEVGHLNFGKLSKLPIKEVERILKDVLRVYASCLYHMFAIYMIGTESVQPESFHVLKDLEFEDLVDFLERFANHRATNNPIDALPITKSFLAIEKAELERFL